MTPLTSRWRRSAVLFSVGLALTAALAGCGSSGSSRSSGTSAGGAAPALNDGKQAADAAGAPGAAPNQGAPQAAQGAPAQGGGAAAAKPAQLPATQRSIVYTGSITVRVENVNTAANELVGLATRAGGMVGGDQRTMDAGRSTATLTLRIPADKFSKALDDISHVGNGKEQSRQVSTQDVTANVGDLAARIQAQQASVDRVRALLARAQTIGEITSVESELSRREADLESLKGQQRSLDDLTALSTIAVTLLGPDAATKALPKAAQGGFLAGLKSGWHAFAAAIRVVLTVLGAVLPFVLILGVPLWLAYWWQRRRSRAAQVSSAQLSSATAAPKAESEA
jgi:hypothetical protein